MKILSILFIALSTLLVNCTQTSEKNDETKSKKPGELNDAEIKAIEAEKTQERAEWNLFKAEADSTINSMEMELSKLSDKMNTSSKKDKERLQEKYNKSKEKVADLKVRIQKRNEEFQTDMQAYNEKISEKNKTFQRELKHDMNELGESMKDLFKDNVK
ncbi:MAG: hypothetical protein IPP69_09210 [Flavobacteriales bacterium]|nr:hypothetical protein [Flavobacteriales bacterium]